MLNTRTSNTNSIYLLECVIANHGRGYLTRDNHHWKFVMNKALCTVQMAMHALVVSVVWRSLLLALGLPMQ
jgi:hypothetical protein